MSYMRRNDTVKAFQFLKGRPHDALYGLISQENVAFDDSESLAIRVPGGWSILHDRDWVVKDNGRVFSCTDAHFKENYIEKPNCGISSSFTDLCKTAAELPRGHWVYNDEHRRIDIIGPDDSISSPIFEDDIARRLCELMNALQQPISCVVIDRTEITPDSFLYSYEAPVGFNHESLPRKLELVLMAFQRFAEYHEETILDFERTLEDVQENLPCPLSAVETSQSVSESDLLRQAYWFDPF